MRAAKAKPPLDGINKYGARKSDCDNCPLRDQCRPGNAARKVLRSILEGSRDLARDLSLTDAYVTSRSERKKVEMLLAATAQNLRKLAKLIPPPELAMAP